MKIKINPGTDWYTIGNYQRVFELSSPFSTWYSLSSPHSLWRWLDSPAPDSLMEGVSDLVAYTAIVEKQMLMALGVDINDWLPTLTEYPEMDFESVMNHFLMFTEQVNPRWIEPGGEIPTLSDCDSALRDYVIYINWLHYWLQVHVKHDALIIE